MTLKRAEYTKVPKLDSAFKCGVYGNYAEDFWDYINIPKIFTKDLAEPYLIDAVGDSMEPKIEAGDICVVDHKKEPRSGDLAAIWLNGTYLIKELWQNNFSLYLVSLNRKYEPIKVKKTDDIKIMGKICGIYKPQ